MIKALAIKELRESAGLVAVAALGMAWVIARCMGTNPLRAFIAGEYTSSHLAFIQDDFYSMACVFVGCLAVLLGLKQSAWEIHHNTFHYLFHRPLQRRSILFVKLVVGIALIFGLPAAMILIYGSWAAIPGNLAAPFEWSMTRDSWLLVLGLPLVYFGAFLSGIRPGRWFGTRLAPLAGAILLVVLYSMAIFWWLQLAILLVGYGAWLVGIDHYTHSRDY